MDRFTVEGPADLARNRLEAIEAGGGERVLRNEDQRPPAQMGALFARAALENAISANRRIA